MKRIFLLFAALAMAAVCHADGQLVATGVGARTWGVGALNGIKVNAPLSVPRAFSPWRIHVTNAVKRTLATSTVIEPTNYVVTATLAYTNDYPVFTELTNRVARYVMARDWQTNVTWSVWTNFEQQAGFDYVRTNYVGTATITNTVTGIAGLDPIWTAIATNGISHVVTNYSATAAGGTVTLANSFGEEWKLTLSGGSASTNCAWDVSRIVMPGGLRVTATDAEKLDLSIHYLTFAD